VIEFIYAPKVMIPLKNFAANKIEQMTKLLHTASCIHIMLNFLSNALGEKKPIFFLTMATKRNFCDGTTSKNTFHYE